ncbi:hypothetical protein HL657_07680 [Methanoculleus sp. YWC-01]|jgi:hypothetical protein|uniref:Uncharacterized protein n=1 Tax=Methanoculleus nereidis TaxID=2735141 RepID=A0ABU3Z2L7_9EURY|nr:hypothetical protein [Methanoculleus sp. YWC-01]MDV4343054.1 hypothetical protein [Methanoculleus sp. YWC-01]PKL55859.1 MAG: hypothetical protein CVV35_07690 [Methanomicrobiales archaeon HGW-Methanomicrobiales-6]
MWLKAWPKLAVAVFGAILYIFAVNLSGDIKELLVDVAAALIAIPIIVVTYELWNDKSHKALNENVYRYAENEMGQAMLEIKAQIKMLLEGYCVYFDAGDVVLKDSVQGNYILQMRDEAKILYDEDGMPYQRKYQADYDGGFEADESDIEEYDIHTVFSIITDVQYLGYQICDIQFEDAIHRLDELIKNSFIMERMDDEENSVIIHLLEALKMLHSFVELHRQDLFLRTDITVQGFEWELSKHQNVLSGTIGLYRLYYREKEEGSEKLVYEQVLDEKIIIDAEENNLLSVYIVNPDYYTIFSDLINEVLSCIRDWRRTNAGFVVVDFDSAQIRRL